MQTVKVHLPKEELQKLGLKDKGNGVPSESITEDAPKKKRVGPDGIILLEGEEPYDSTD